MPEIKLRPIVFKVEPPAPTVTLLKELAAITYTKNSGYHNQDIGVSPTQQYVCLISDYDLTSLPSSSGKYFTGFQKQGQAGFLQLCNVGSTLTSFKMAFDVSGSTGTSSVVADDGATLYSGYIYNANLTATHAAVKFIFDITNNTFSFYLKPSSASSWTKICHGSISITDDMSIWQVYQNSNEYAGTAGPYQVYESSDVSLLEAL